MNLLLWMFTPRLQDKFLQPQLLLVSIVGFHQLLKMMGVFAQSDLDFFHQLVCL